MSAQAKPYIGGQAVIEGVMMRSPGCLTVAVRRPDGTIALREGPMKSKVAASKLWKLPGLRGVATLVESMSMGMGALRFSAEQQFAEGEEQPSEGSTRIAMMISTVFALGLFMVLPQLLTELTIRFGHLTTQQQSPAYHAMTGGFKLAVLSGYLFAISRLKDVQRVFQYHGAEHKTIFAYEAELPLTVENVRKQSTLHPRCGTTFLIVVVFISIAVGIVFTPLILPHAHGVSGFFQTLLLRIALLPLIAAVSFEFQRMTARYCTTGPLRVLLWPGFLFQKVTTREPTDPQIEIAIAAMRAAVWREQVGPTIPSDDKPLVFASFDGFVEALSSSLRGAPSPSAS
ncbi:MAG: DUF1385 domain-containing protein [Sandaracinaceae bacterium]|jgi:uncharacterized protein YqhQ|nr:DUF1385 domain-containing protein [Sandaracinaceae bacterium]